MKVTLIITTCALLILPSCSSPKTTEPVAVVEQQPTLVGRVSKVNAAAGYAFIRRYGAWKPRAGDVLQSHGETNDIISAGNLMATGERIGEHVAADIRSGVVNIGDGVYQSPQHTVKDADITLDIPE